MFKKIKSVVYEQLTMGVTPEKLSQSLIGGMLIGMFPLLGTTTLLAALLGHFFKLNHVVIQSANYLMYPVQILLIPVYIKVVSLIFDVGNVPIRPDLILKQFNDSPGHFFKLYGLIGVYSIGLWCVMSVVLYFLLFPVIFKIIFKIKQGRQSWNG